LTSDRYARYPIIQLNVVPKADFRAHVGFLAQSGHWTSVQLDPETKNPHSPRWKRTLREIRVVTYAIRLMKLQ